MHGYCKPLGSVTARFSRIHKNWYGHDHTSHTFAASLGHTGIWDILLYDNFSLSMVANTGVGSGGAAGTEAPLKLEEREQHPLN